MICVTEERILIPTYPEAGREELPMFAENRVHQRTSGNPYPNKVVLEAQRKVREERPYTLLHLENEFLDIGILPELGGKIWYARDKKKDYSFFYKNNVVKPALIGVLGSWTSGGLEFNWPFHHRASTFMPVDYFIERGKDYAIVWLSEHEPINRMKGMVGVKLCEGECIFETCVKLDNTTQVRHSFLWWENAAVPAGEDYEIFFPEDVNYVRFHYKRSVTTYPIANNDRFGAFNGIYYDGDTDISKHKSTRKATSYFSAESKYDYFGGYDSAKKAGVVHIADHHISPGKKMFTWAYSQLAKTWENALTDNDGQYAELMAGCYSDNQPDLTWLMPGETRRFSQYWFPIHDAGKPTFANQNGALYWDEHGACLQCVRAFVNAELNIWQDGTLIRESTLSLPAYELFRICELPLNTGVRIRITQNGQTIFDYTREVQKEREIPDVRPELPDFKTVKTAQALYLEGLHAEQYRSPEYSAEAFYLEALQREADYAPAAASLAELALKRNDAQKALEYALLAEKSATRFNIRTESGRIYYLKGLALCALGRMEEGYDALSLAAWSYDYRLAAMTELGLLDLQRREYAKAVEHLEEAVNANQRGVVAVALLGYAKALLGDEAGALLLWEDALRHDPLNLYVHACQAVWKQDYTDFCALLKTDATQVLLDIAERFYKAGLCKETEALLLGVMQTHPLDAMAHYLLADLQNTTPQAAPIGIAYPSRTFELSLLQRRLEKDPTDDTARYLLACLLYGCGRYECGIREFETLAAKKPTAAVLRNLAMGYYSHRNDGEKALACMKRALDLSPASDRQITFEAAYLMAKSNLPAQKIIDLIDSRESDRDDIIVELARAYNHNGEPDKALELLLGRKFVACEGGEHSIADQYMYAYYLKGKKAYQTGNYAQARTYFEEAQILPQSLGSGLWNDIKKVPYAYFAARCYEKMGDTAAAEEIYQSFLHYRFDYFTDMYLYTYAYYAARALAALGKKADADALIEKRFAAFDTAAKLQTPGYFGTTPFFIGFIDDADRARKLHYAYPLYLFATYLGKETVAASYQSILDSDGYGLYIEDFTL